MYCIILLLQVIRTCHRQLTPEEEVAEEKVTTAVHKFMSSDTKESFAYTKVQCM